MKKIVGEISYFYNIIVLLYYIGELNYCIEWISKMIKGFINLVKIGKNKYVVMCKWLELKVLINVMVNFILWNVVFVYFIKNVDIIKSNDEIINKVK